MFAWPRRSLLIVKEETPTSYFCDPTPAMIESNDAVSNLAFRPSFCATRVNRSTSKPSIVVPSAARNSLGAYVVSLPTVRTPSDLMLDGTLAASAESADALAELDPPELPLPDEPPPQPEITRAALARAAAAVAERRIRERLGTGSLLQRDWSQRSCPARSAHGGRVRSH